MCMVYQHNFMHAPQLLHAGNYYSVSEITKTIFTHHKSVMIIISYMPTYFDFLC